MCWHEGKKMVAVPERGLHRRVRENGDSVTV